MTNPSPLKVARPTDFHERFGTAPEDALTPTPKPMAGRWYLIAPDGSDFQGDSPIECLKAELASRVPAKVALARIAEGLNEADATPQPSPEGGEAERELFEMVGREMVRITTTVRGPEEWLAIPELWQQCARERDGLRAILSRKETPHASD